MGEWRPFEPSRDEIKRIERESGANSKHIDCALADSMALLHGRMAVHCHDECCEECFGC